MGAVAGFLVLPGLCQSPSQRKLSLRKRSNLTEIHLTGENITVQTGPALTAPEFCKYWAAVFSFLNFRRLILFWSALLPTIPSFVAHQCNCGVKFEPCWIQGQHKVPLLFSSLHLSRLVTWGTWPQLFAQAVLQGHHQRDGEAVPCLFSFIGPWLMVGTLTKFQF